MPLSDKMPRDHACNPQAVTHSIIIPVFNEEESLEILCRELVMVMGERPEPFEIIFVNDGSTDNSRQVLDRMLHQFPGQVRVIDQPSRQGQTAALRRGGEAARGSIVITMDADLQNDPADIPLILAKIGQGYDVVCGWRKNRQDKPLKTFLSKSANFLQRRLTGMTIHDLSCTLRAYQREWFHRLDLSWEGQHRFIPVILTFQGCRIGEVESHHRKRRFGCSKYSHKRIFKVMWDFIRVFSTRKQYSQIQKFPPGEPK